MFSALLRVLIVEDQATDLELTIHLLRKSGFEPAWRNVHGRSEYLKALEDPPDVILADFTLPGFDALEALRLLHERDLDIPFIVVSGTISEEVAVECMKLGASDYLLKDRLSRLGPAISQALEKKRLRDEQKVSQAQLRLLSSAVEQSTEGVGVSDLDGNLLYANKALAAMHGYTQAELRSRHVSLFYSPDFLHLLEAAHKQVLLTGEYTGEFPRLVRDRPAFPSLTHLSLLKNEQGHPTGIVRTVRDISIQKQAERKIRDLLEHLRLSNRDLAASYDATLEGWVRFLDLRDHATEGHTKRVADLTLALADRIGYTAADRIHLRRGALLHDIGKMGIPDSILQKPGPLNDEEWEIMRRHPDFAHEMLAPIGYLQPALDIPKHHHEKWDGSGYPDNLSGTEIPLAARLFAIADVWDALKSDRPYRSAWPEDQIVEYFKDEAGKHFDPEYVPVFLDFVASR
ncbi:MAG TPA: HD domain-containing phosphohydrolase [Anaerolineales bacterium]|nr:HD domain-containing phosphohydrolase [Anaerolineales bacterium]